MGFTSFNTVLSFLSVVSLVWAAGNNNHQWPSAIKRCAVNDPNLNKCVRRQTEVAIARLSKGMPSLGLRPLDPLRNVSFEMASSRDGPVVVTFQATNVVITGPSKVQLRKVYVDKKTSTYFIEGYHNLVKMAGKYKVKGNILVFPIDSTGTFEWEIRGGFANHSVKFANNVRSGGHGQVRFILKSYKSMRANLRDSQLGEEGSATLTQIVNDNWSAVYDALWDPMEKVVQKVYGLALKPLTSKFNAQDFFPTTISGRSEADETTFDDKTAFDDVTMFDDDTTPTPENAPTD